eukprot:XP_014774518.1 PREDICTED: uncharacterized protein LOC106872153 [Octopus bimaculoides]
MRPRTCRRYCAYGIIIFIGYLIMQGFIKTNKELKSDTDENDVIISRSDNFEKENDKEILKAKQDKKPDKHSDTSRDQKSEDDIRDQILHKAEEAIEAKEKALKLEHELKEEEERRHKLELKLQEELLREEEEKRKKLEEEKVRRLAEKKKEEELREELVRLHKELEKNTHTVSPREQVPHHPDEDHHTDEHYKYFYVSKGKEASPVHGRHFALKATQVEHEIEEQVEKHLEYLPEHRFPTIVTAATMKNFRDVEKLIDSVQYFLPDKKIVVFNIDLGDKEVDELQTACNVETRIFWKWMFPSHVYNASDMSWRPVIIQMALAEFGLVMWINPTTRLVSSHFEPFLSDAEQSGLVVLSTRKQYSTFSVTHPSMYSYIPTDMTKLMETSHLNMRVLIIHNTHEIQVAYHGDHFKDASLLISQTRNENNPQANVLLAGDFNFLSLSRPEGYIQTKIKQLNRRDMSTNDSYLVVVDAVAVVIIVTTVILYDIVVVIDIQLLLNLDYTTNSIKCSEKYQISQQWAVLQVQLRKKPILEQRKTKL